MCNISPGDKCRDGRDGNAGSGWLSKSDFFIIIEKECVQTLRIRLIIAKTSPVEI